MVLSTSSPRLPPLHAHPPPPPPPRLSSIPTNPTASSHYMALFRLCIVFSSSQVGLGLGDFRPLIGLDRLLKLKKLPNNHSISTPVCPCDTENLVGGTQGVWASSYQTVTDPYPVTQTVPGRRFGRYSAILVCVCVCVLWTGWSWFSSTEQTRRDSFTPYTGLESCFAWLSGSK